MAFKMFQEFPTVSLDITRTIQFVKYTRKSCRWLNTTGTNLSSPWHRNNKTGQFNQVTASVVVGLYVHENLLLHGLYVDERGPGFVYQGSLLSQVYLTYGKKKKKKKARHYLRRKNHAINGAENVCSGSQSTENKNRRLSWRHTSKIFQPDRNSSFLHIWINYLLFMSHHLVGKNVWLSGQRLEIGF